MQRRARSTSMKDRQNSRTQSERNTSMDSECSPEARLVTQVGAHKYNSRQTSINTAQNSQQKTQQLLFYLCGLLYAVFNDLCYNLILYGYIFCFDYEGPLKTFLLHQGSPDPRKFENS